MSETEPVGAASEHEKPQDDAAASARIKFAETVDESPSETNDDNPAANDDDDDDIDEGVDKFRASPTPRDILESLEESEADGDDDVNNNGDGLQTSSSYMDMAFESEEMRQLLSYQSLDMPRWSSVEDMVYKQADLFPDWVRPNPVLASATSGPCLAAFACNPKPHPDPSRLHCTGAA